MKLLPSGTVTFLFTDIEGSTRLAREHPDTWEALRERHHAILRSAIDSHHGYVFQVIGDAFCAAFHTASNGLNAGLEAQRRLQKEDWGVTPLKVRMGLHTGSAELLGTDYRGYLTLVKVQRIMSAAYGGQVLLSGMTADLVRTELPPGISLRDIKEHRLKGLPDPERLWQMAAPDLPQDFPPLQSLMETPNNLPVQLTSFIGREKEVEQVRKRLGKNRLVTLTGSGGIGKTRLSIQVASQLLDEYPSGVWLVELAPVTDPALVPQTICTVLRVIPDGGMSALDALKNYVQTKKALFVLDNCEHLIDACAQLCEAVLHACPSAQIIASSREALGIDGESAYRVPSLSLPDARKGIDTGEESEAVKLFLERAGAVLPEFELTPSNAPVIAQICRRLDGIALAIELAASRVRLLNVEQIAARLDDAFRLLTGGSRTALPRQQTLRALIDWSHNLLSNDERSVFRELSVFTGGWTVEAAEAVCDHPETLDLLGHLVDKSLVTVDRDSSEAPRYYFLETIRQYAREKLAETEESESLRDRHLAYFLKFAEHAEQKLQGREQKEWLVRLERDHDNLRAALEWSLRYSPEFGLRLAVALRDFWDTHGHMTEARQWLERTLDATRSLPPDSTRVRALVAAMGFATRQTDFESWSLFTGQCLALSRELNDRWGMAQCLTSQGLLKEYYEGDITHAEPYYDEALSLARQLGDRLFIGQALGPLASCALKRYQYEQAVDIYSESLMFFREVENEREIAGAVGNLAEVALFRRDYETARDHAQESLALYRELEDKHGIATALRILCHVLQNQGRGMEARAAGEQSVSLFRDINDRGCKGLSLTILASSMRVMGDIQNAKAIAHEAAAVLQVVGDKIPEVMAMNVLARLALDQDDLSGARKYFRHGLDLLEEIKDITQLPSLLEGLGYVLASSSKTRDAILLLAAADTSRQKTRLAVIQTERADYDRTLSLLHSQTDETSFQAIWQEGRAMSPEEVMRRVLFPAEDQVHRSY